ncbi:MAG: hypothetical protein WCE23_13360 [Candidatus Binatus sp.]|uniref:hypothetical protein n=1 Tax=Candidatus Binatus sp. TaxID=2811406 RepID=UPI003C75982B
MTNFIIYKTEAVQPDEFAAFWASKFDSNGYPEEPYANSIGNLTRDAIEALFEWKNGMRLSTRKARSIENNFIARIGEAKALGAKASPKEFLQKFAMGGAIWRIFWLLSTPD